MISNSDFEKAWFLYKTEYEPKHISINDFCIRKGLPYTEFNKWFRKTHKRIVPVEVEGMPVASDDEQQIAGMRCKARRISEMIRATYHRDPLNGNVYKIEWKSLVSVLESPVIKSISLQWYGDSR